MSSISSEEIISVLKSEIENYDTMSKDQEVSMTVLLKICTALNVNLSEVAEITE